LAAALSDFELNDAATATAADTTATEKTESVAAVKLFLAGTEHPIESFDNVVALLKEVVVGLTKSNNVDAPSFMDGDGTATTKAVMNFCDRHLPDTHALVLITSSDISLPGTVLQSLTDRGCSVHCHDAADDLNERLRREDARSGDVTVSLAWDTVDDLDLHVIVPGGEEIYYGNRRSKDGLCNLDVDMNAGSPYSKEPVENVFLGDLDKMVQAPLGHYKVVVQNYAYHSGNRVPVSFRVIVGQNGVKKTYEGECKGSGSKSNVTVCEFDYQGRTIPFPSEEKAKTAFGTANMVNLTASTGQTLESIAQLVQVVQRHEHLDNVRTLVAEEADDEVADEPMQDDEGMVDERQSGMEEELSEEVQVEPEQANATRPTQALHGTLEVTNRDRINILLSKLPRRFHEIVGEVFGGPTLAEMCAEDIARRMVADRIPVSQLRSSGYPRDIMDAVKDKMAVVDVSM